MSFDYWRFYVRCEENGEGNSVVLKVYQADNTEKGIDPNEPTGLKEAGDSNVARSTKIEGVEHDILIEWIFCIRIRKDLIKNASYMPAIVACDKSGNDIPQGFPFRCIKKNLTLQQPDENSGEEPYYICSIVLGGLQDPGVMHYKACIIAYTKSDDYPIAASEVYSIDTSSLTNVPSCASDGVIRISNRNTVRIEDGMRTVGEELVIGYPGEKLSVFSLKQKSDVELPAYFLCDVSGPKSLSTAGTDTDTITITNQDPVVWQFSLPVKFLGDEPWIPYIEFIDDKGKETETKSAYGPFNHISTFNGPVYAGADGKPWVDRFVVGNGYRMYKEYSWRAGVRGYLNQQSVDIPVMLTEDPTVDNDGDPVKP